MSRPILPNYHQGAAYSQPEQRAQHVPTASASAAQYAPQPPESPSAASTDEMSAGPSGYGSASTLASRPTYSKRGKITIVACVPCRKRKTKCDGQRPACSQCASRRQACFYDMTDDQRKLTHLRESVDYYQEKSGALEYLLQTVQTSNDDEASEIFRRLRSGQSLQVVADQVQASHVLSGVSASPDKADLHQFEPGEEHLISPEHRAGRHLDFEHLVHVLSESDNDAAMGIVRRLRNREEISSILKSVDLSVPNSDVWQRESPQSPARSLEHTYARDDQAFGMVKGTEIIPTHMVHGKSSEFTIDEMQRPWTNATRDAELIEHLIELYFTWQHSFFQSFPEKLFRADMAVGRTKYCSAMLVNTICACGCFLSDRPVTQKDRGDGKTLTDTFYEEAKDLLSHEDSSNLTTVAALCLLSYIEGTKGRITALWLHTGRSALMGIDINLHLQRKSLARSADPAENEERANEERARSHAFWGSFHADATSSFTLGRLANYNVNGVTCELPMVDDAADAEIWSVPESNLPHRPGARSSTFRYCAKLSEIINATLLIFFAPTVSLSGRLLVEQYGKYLEWKRTLPAILAVNEQSPPHVLSLHMYYHTAVLLLFRPFTKAKITNDPDVVPREICRQSANEISALFSLHMKLFGQAGICMFQVHCLLSACTIHIINLPTISATREFTTACKMLHAHVKRNEWARSSIRILRSLTKKWSLILPLEAEEALLQKMPGDNGEGSSGIGPSGGDPTPRNPQSLTDSAAAIERPEDLPAFPQMDITANLDPALSQQGQPPQKRQRIMASDGQAPQPARVQTTEGSPRSATGPASPRQGGQNNPANYLYSPLENQPTPFLVPVRSQRPSKASGEKQRWTSSGHHDAERHGRQRHERQSTRAMESGATESGTADAKARASDNGAEQSARAAAKVEEHDEGIEGISFRDDWRDPFMGFDQVD